MRSSTNAQQKYPLYLIAENRDKIVVNYFSFEGERSESYSSFQGASLNELLLKKSGKTWDDILVFLNMITCTGLHMLNRKGFKNNLMRQLILLSFLLSLVMFSHAQDAENKLKALNIQLPEISKPLANYVHVVRSGNLLFLAGKGPSKPDGTYIVGKVGKDITIEQGKEAARLTAINQLAVLKTELGNLNKIKRIVKVLGMVNCEADFKDHSKVINGFSDLLVEVFGEKGKHARSAVGMCSLPNNMAVEIELIVEISK